MINFYYFKFLVILTIVDFTNCQNGTSIILDIFNETLEYITSPNATTDLQEYSTENNFCNFYYVKFTVNNLFFDTYPWGVKGEKFTKNSRTLETTTEDHNDPELHLLVIVCVTGVCILLLILVITVVYYRRKAERDRESQLNRRLKERPFSLVVDPETGQSIRHRDPQKDPNDSLSSHESSKFESLPPIKPKTTQSEMSNRSKVMSKIRKREPHRIKRSKKLLAKKAPKSYLLPKKDAPIPLKSGTKGKSSEIRKTTEKKVSRSPKIATKKFPSGNSSPSNSRSVITN